MRVTRTLSLITAACALLASCATSPPTGPMGFFITSAGSGKGADLGGLAGADAQCQKLAAAAGAGAVGEQGMELRVRAWLGGITERFPQGHHY